MLNWQREDQALSRLEEEQEEEEWKSFMRSRKRRLT